jgi:hypothetical protein
MLHCLVLRTHRFGQCLRDVDYGEPMEGVVSMYSTYHQLLRRHVQVMTLDSQGQFGALQKSAIPDLLEPQLLTFGSNRGMMVSGMEEISGHRYYQGWWIQWPKGSR